MEIQYVYFDGQIFSKKELTIPINLCNSESFFSVTHYARSAHNRIFFFQHLVERLKSDLYNCSIQDLPSLLQEKGRGLKQAITRTINRNKYHKGVEVQVTCFIVGNDEVRFYIAVIPTTYNYTQPPQDLFWESYDISQHKLTIYGLHEIEQQLKSHAQRYKIDKCIPFDGTKLSLYRRYDFILVDASGTLQYEKQHFSYIRDPILSLVEDSISSPSLISLDNILEAQECLVIDDRYGIFSLKGVNNKRYYRDIGDQIHKKLTQVVEERYFPDDFA